MGQRKEWAEIERGGTGVLHGEIWRMENGEWRMENGEWRIRRVDENFKK
jgi:hypothetical protein